MGIKTTSEAFEMEKRKIQLHKVLQLHLSMVYIPKDGGGCPL